MKSPDKKNDHRKGFLVALYDQTFELQEKAQESPDRYELLGISEEGSSQKVTAYFERVTTPSSTRNYHKKGYQQAIRLGQWKA